MKGNFKVSVDLPSEEILSSCIHCGMCLQVCPTYNLTFDELSSPRGRIRLIKSVLEGSLEITDKFVHEMNFCLDCQACETACPAGIKYGLLVEAARVQIEYSDKVSRFSKPIKKIFFRKIIPDFKLLKSLSRLLRFYQKSILRKILIKFGFLRVISNKLQEIEKLSPAISEFFSDEILSEMIEAKGQKKFRVLFPVGCLMNVMFADINKDTVELLTKLGCDVIVPKDQTCCGSLQAHNGDMEIARIQAKKTIDLFMKYEFDYIISNSAGCGAFMKEYIHILKSEPEYSEIAKNFSLKVKDIMEFLYENFDFSSFEYNGNDHITYHHACHLTHTQKIVNEPTAVLQQIRGLKLVPLDEATWCCGSAGIYNLVNYDYSMMILERKMINIKNTNAKIVLTGNPGCIGQLRYGADKFNAKIDVLHPVTLLNRIVKNENRI